MDLDIEAAGERLILLPERAVFWERRQTLFIADAHWGKAATMRAAAIPIPGGTTKESLERLSRIVQRTACRRIVLLGDCLHAKEGRAPGTLGAVAAWRENHPALDLLLIRGNHDRRAGDPPNELGFRCQNAPLFDPPFVYRHYPTTSDEGFTLAGHLHPGIRLHGNGAERATIPCFWFTPHAAILPAFGGLTGMARIKPGAGDRICAIAHDEIVAISF